MKKKKAHVRQKSKLALQIVSKCGTPSGRDLLTAQLSELIPLELFGACSGNVCDQQCYRREMKSHFFYLAFENSVCPQYVTEKFWNAFRALTVPVVLNRAVLRGMQVPADAFIAADDFCSVHELAEHLTALQRDTERYIR
uniref:Fucosyltransferase n=1 Tax=Globodera pallida TaxID=36090 RepID=A0A183C8G9_GLOPA